MGIQFPTSTIDYILASANATIGNNIILFGTLFGVIGGVAVIGILFSFFHK